MPAITIRKFRFKFESLPKQWYSGCPVRSHIFNSISLMVPAFEKMAISSVLPYSKSILDKTLAQEVKAFIGQEAHHGNGFVRFNAALMQHGYPLKKLERYNLTLFKFMVGLLSAKTHLALTVATEHLTAIFSDITLKYNFFSDTPAQCNKLWLWHAVEEIEHKSVAFDVYQYHGGGYCRRVLAMLFVSIAFMILTGFNFTVLMFVDKQWRRLSNYKALFSFLFWREKFLLRMFKQYFVYFKPGFHPWQLDNRQLIKDF